MNDLIQRARIAALVAAPVLMAIATMAPRIGRG